MYQVGNMFLRSGICNHQLLNLLVYSGLVVFLFCNVSFFSVEGVNR